MIQIRRNNRRYHSRSHDDLWVSALKYLRKAGPRPSFQFFYILRATSTQYQTILKELAHVGLIRYIENNDELSPFTKKAKVLVEITDKGNLYYEKMEELAKLISKPSNLANLDKHGLESPMPPETKRRRMRTSSIRKREGNYSYGKALFNQSRHYDSKQQQ